MTIDERLEAMAIRIEGLVRNAELTNREIEAWRERSRQDTEEIHSMIRALAVRHEALTQRHEALTQRHEALTERHEALTERHEALTQRHEALTERHEALTMNSELMGRDIEALRDMARQDGENIRALARIAEMHERRLSDLEEPPS